MKALDIMDHVTPLHLTWVTTKVEKSRKLGMMLSLVHKDRLYLHLHYCTHCILCNKATVCHVHLSFLYSVGCEYYEFACDNGWQCVSNYQKCDGRVDCYGGSDEDDCELLHNM